MRVHREGIAFLSKMLGILTVLQLLHVSLATSTNEFKARKLPLGYRDEVLPAETFSRVARGNVGSSQATWSKTNLALDPNGSCSSYVSTLSTTFDVIQDMVGY